MKYAGNNSPEYWDHSWTINRKKFPKHTMDLITKMIPDFSYVLDIGCGDGTFLLRLKRDKSCRVFGIDISKVAIEKANELGVTSRVISAEELDDFNWHGGFDVTVCSHLLEHIENDDNLVKNIYRLTNKLAIIAVPNDCSYPEETGEHVRKYTAETLKKLLSKYFREVEDHTRLNRLTLKNHLIMKCLK